MARATKRELALHYALGPVLREMGVYDACVGEFVPRSMHLGDISYEYVAERTQGVLDAARVAVKNKTFDAQIEERFAVQERLAEAVAWRREALRSRREIKNYRMILGLESEQG